MKTDTGTGARPVCVVHDRLLFCSDGLAAGEVAGLRENKIVDLQSPVRYAKPSNRSRQEGVSVICRAPFCPHLSMLPWLECVADVGKMHSIEKQLTRPSLKGAAIPLLDDHHLSWTHWVTSIWLHSLNPFRQYSSRLFNLPKVQILQYQFTAFPAFTRGEVQKQTKKYRTGSAGVAPALNSCRQCRPTVNDYLLQSKRCRNDTVWPHNNPRSLIPLSISDFAVSKSSEPCSNGHRCDGTATFEALCGTNSLTEFVNKNSCMR